MRPADYSTLYRRARQSSDQELRARYLRAAREAKRHATSGCAGGACGPQGACQRAFLAALGLVADRIGSEDWARHEEKLDQMIQLREG